MPKKGGNGVFSPLRYVSNEKVTIWISISKENSLFFLLALLCYFIKCAFIYSFRGKHEVVESLWKSLNVTGLGGHLKKCLTLRVWRPCPRFP